MDYSIIYSYFFIFFARIIDMSLDVIRILMLTRDKRIMAAILGFVEVTVFILALGQVFAGGLNDPFKIAAYAGGFASGNYLGSIIEEKLAIGYLSLQVFPDARYVHLFEKKFREMGFGVTSVIGQGRNGPRTIMFVLMKRKDLLRALDLLNLIDDTTFFSVTDARQIHGGVFPGRRLTK